MTLAGGAAPKACKAVAAAERSLAEARDPGRTPRLKTKTVSDFSAAAATLRELTCAPPECRTRGFEKVEARLIAKIRRALSTQFEGPLPPELAAKLATAYGDLEEAARVALGPGRKFEISTMDPRPGLRRALVEEMLEQAGTGTVVAADWNGCGVYAKPGESADEVLARYDADVKNPSSASSMLGLLALAQTRVADELAASRFAATGLQAARPPQIVERDFRQRLEGHGVLVHLRELSHPDEILAYGQALEHATRGWRRSAIAELYDAMSDKLMVPGTEPAWNLVFERLARTP